MSKIVEWEVALTTIVLDLTPQKSLRFVDQLCLVFIMHVIRIKEIIVREIVDVIKPGFHMIVTPLWNLTIQICFTIIHGRRNCIWKGGKVSKEIFQAAKYSKVAKAVLGESGGTCFPDPQFLRLCYLSKANGILVRLRNHSLKATAT